LRGPVGALSSQMKLAGSRCHDDQRSTYAELAHTRGGARYLRRFFADCFAVGFVEGLLWKWRRVAGYTVYTRHWTRAELLGHAVSRHDEDRLALMGER